MRRKTRYFLLAALATVLVGGKLYQHEENENTLSSQSTSQSTAKTDESTGKIVTLADIPEYSGKPYVEVNNNQPNMANHELSSKTFERYSPLDKLGRCGVAVANLGKETMPTEKRGQIGQVKPSGWHTTKYPNVEGKYLYNRCHLIGFQLSGENANPRNLITGTRYLNVNGMLPFENLVADYIKSTGNHVLYRVTPLYEGNDLVAKGVLMEAKSDEDQGKGVQYAVFVYNVQPGIRINYATGTSVLVNANKRAPSVSLSTKSTN